MVAQEQANRDRLVIHDGTRQAEEMRTCSRHRLLQGERTTQAGRPHAMLASASGVPRAAALAPGTVTQATRGELQSPTYSLPSGRSHSPGHHGCPPDRTCRGTRTPALRPPPPPTWSPLLLFQAFPTLRQEIFPVLVPNSPRVSLCRFNDLIHAEFILVVRYGLSPRNSS